MIHVIFCPKDERTIQSSMYPPVYCHGCRKTIDCFKKEFKNGKFINWNASHNDSERSVCTPSKKM